MNKYTVVYEIHNGEYPMPLEQNETIEAESIEDAIYKIKEKCYLNYMSCEIISVAKENHYGKLNW